MRLYSMFKDMHVGLGEYIVVDMWILLSHSVIILDYNSSQKAWCTYWCGHCWTLWRFFWRWPSTRPWVQVSLWLNVFFLYGFSLKRKVKPTCLHSAATSKSVIGSYASLNFQILPGLWKPWLSWLYNREVYEHGIKRVKLDPFRFVCKVFEI